MLAVLSSLAVGAVGGYYSRKIRRMLGYSGVGHIGWMVLALYLGNIYALTAYILMYCLASFVLWRVVEIEGRVYVQEWSQLLKT